MSLTTGQLAPTISHFASKDTSRKTRISSSWKKQSMTLMCAFNHGLVLRRLTSASDQLANADAGVDTTDYAEWLTRVILGADPSNTFMMLSAFKPDFWYINGAEKHSPVSTYYVSSF